MESLPFFGLLE